MTKVITIIALFLFSGCAARKPMASHTPEQLHLGSPHLECDLGNNCEIVQSWLTPQNKPLLTPLGCWLAKAQITWIFGDRVSMCAQKWQVPPAEAGH